LEFSIQFPRMPVSSSGKSTASIYWLIVVFGSVAVLLLVVFWPQFLSVPPPKDGGEPAVGIAKFVPDVVVGEPEGSPTTTVAALWFVGDVMLSRDVAARVRRSGDPGHAWNGTRALFGGEPLVVNFESCLSETLQYDGRSSMRFPVGTSVLPVLAEVGVTHVSLANNHALDCGREDLARMPAHFARHGINAFGHPVVVSTTSLSYVPFGDKSIALVGVHTLFAEPDPDVLRTLLTEAASSSDLQIAFVHWGDEYTLRANAAQRDLAQVLIDSGIDAVIGHHPHVIQDIERRDGVLVFYSLGNFIFDQYFSEEVLTGLVLRLAYRQGALGFELHPVSTASQYVVPAPLTGESRQAVLDALSDRSAIAIRGAVRAGWLPLSEVASSQKPAIISP
jgi:poly-gamma-glutamate synthesis protein (capsule biosynthesis protein)